MLDISRQQIKQLQFNQLVGIPIPALVLGVISLKINFLSDSFNLLDHRFNCLDSSLNLSDHSFNCLGSYNAILEGYNFWKWIAVWALVAGALLIYSVDFIWDCREWKRKEHVTPISWTRISWGWLFTSIAMWFGLVGIVVDTVGLDGFIELIGLLISNEYVVLLVLSVLVYGLIISVFKNAKVLMILIIPLVVTLAIHFSQYSFLEYLRIENVTWSLDSKYGNFMFPFSVFTIFCLNVLLVQKYEIPKDNALQNYNIWTNYPRIAKILWWTVFILFWVITIKMENNHPSKTKWGEVLISLIYVFLYVIEMFPRIDLTPVRWLRNSGYRFTVDLLLLGMII